jgi:hypothetical protein
VEIGIADFRRVYYSCVVGVHGGVVSFYIITGVNKFFIGFVWRGCITMLMVV